MCHDPYTGAWGIKSVGHDPGFGPVGRDIFGWVPKSTCRTGFKALTIF